MGTKQWAKQAAQKYPWLWNAYQFAKHQFIRLRTAGYYAYDLRRTIRHMHWPASGKDPWPLSAELLFQYHKLEKGMVMPGAPRIFGTDPVLATMALVRRWERAGYSLADPIYVGAIGTVRCYASRLQALGLAAKAPAANEIESFLSERIRVQGIVTPVPLSPPDAEVEGTALAAFGALSLSRRSIRDFDERPVPKNMIEEAVRLASLSPTACNRQPNKIILLDDRRDIEQALTFQNGNRGFGHRVPLLAVLVVDSTGYFNGSERNQPYVDGGLFAMSLMLSLRAMGLGSCSLNWCVSPSTDRKFRRLGHVRDEEMITMLLAVGFPGEGVTVPLSPRRDTRQVMRWSRVHPLV